LTKLKNKEFIKLFKFIKPKALPYFIGLIGCALVEAALSNLIPFMIKDAADAAVKKQMNEIFRVCIMLCISVIILSILTPTFNYLFSSTIKKIMAGIRIHAFRHIEELEAGYYENTHSGDIISRLTNDITVMENAYSGNIRSILSLIFTAVYAAAVMMIWDWRLASVLILMGIATAYLNSRFASSVRKLSNKLQSNTGILTEFLTDIFAGFYCLKMFHIQDIVLGRYNEANKSITRLSMERSKSYALLNSTNFLISWINNGGALIIGAYMMLKGMCSLGTLLGMVILLQNVTTLFMRLGNFIAELQSSMAGAARLFELLDMPAEPERYNLTQGGSKNGMIELENITFSYKGGKTILDNLSLKVDNESIAAIVGPSGGGKSTIIKLLLGFYPPNSGSIIINGYSFGEYTLKELRDKIAYVSQDAYLFDGTIEENISYGRLNASKDEIISAAIMANAHEFIISQKDGYETRVGERGARLSGGQKQRIAIARAFLKDAPILLLDEATSALDLESEQLVQKALDTLMKGRTTIIIAHRLSTIEHADIIFVVDRGKVIELGNHKELIALEGLYKKMYNMQFKQEKSVSA
jgi:ABC-type multidrug transport system fused ATPase/permease subunit